MHGLSASVDSTKAVAALHLTGGHRVLDVACGPGKYTSAFASRLTGDGFVIGVDASGQTWSVPRSTTATTAWSTCVPTP